MKYEFTIAPRFFDWNAGWQDWLAQKSSGEKAHLPTPRCFILLMFRMAPWARVPVWPPVPAFGLHLVQRHGGRFFLPGHHLDQELAQDGRIRPLQQLHGPIQRLAGKSGLFQLPAFLIQALHGLRPSMRLVIRRFGTGPAEPGRSVPEWPPGRGPACPRRSR